jgi:hypothetical protein
MSTTITSTTNNNNTEEKLDDSKTTTTNNLLLPPTFISHHGNILEIAIHRPLKALQREMTTFLKGVIGDGFLEPSEIPYTLIITTCQKSNVGLFVLGDEQEAEKQRLLESFLDFAKEICNELTKLGKWADFADPTSGLLFSSSGQVPWPEVQAMERLRKYKIAQTGRCHVVMHPDWGYNMYPASLFTNASWEQLQQVLQQHVTTI